VKVLDLAAASQKAYRLLSSRPHSEKELATKLRGKGFPEAVIKEALEKLRDLQYLNDASFALQWARNKAVNGLWGNRKIITGLKEKGVAAGSIDDAIAAARQELSEEEALAVLIRKKAAGKMAADFDIKEKKRIFQSLMARGFPPGLILNKLGKAAEEDFNGEDGV
jgi:regulatory protein